MKDNIHTVSAILLLIASGLYGQTRPESYYSFGYGESTDLTVPLFDFNYDHNLYFQYERQFRSSSFHWGGRLDFSTYESVQNGGNDFPIHFSFQKDRQFALNGQVKSDPLDAGIKQLATYDGFDLFFRLTPSVSFDRHWTKRLLAGIALGQSFWYYKLQGLNNSDILTVTDPRYTPQQSDYALLLSPAYLRGFDFSQQLRPELSFRVWRTVSLATNAVFDYNVFRDEVFGLWMFMGFKFKI